MKTYIPDYYNSFSCIADKCKHSCCIGWEIDIDEDSVKYYRTVKDDFGKKLNDNIENSTIPHFILSGNERCPFLNKNNLCDIYINLGEDKLCQICTDHPRFRNFFDSRTEIGLGLCCEAAAKLILTRKEKFTLLECGSYDEYDVPPEEELFFNTRSNIFNILQNRSFSIDERITELLHRYKITLPDKTLHEWLEIFLSLECMDENWHKKLKEYDCENHKNPLTDEKWEIAFEQLVIYFIYRHLADGLYDGRLRERIAFAILSFHIIRSLCISHHSLYGQAALDDLIEISRMYSSEIEYCEENIDSLLKRITL